MSIGERIRIRREQLGMSQEELAIKIGYKSRSSINKIELDQYSLKQSKIKSIADALQTTPAYIMGWEEDNVQQQAFLCELFEQCYGKESYTAVQMFLRLDEADRKTVVRMMTVMLTDEKYINQETGSFAG